MKHLARTLVVALACCGVAEAQPAPDAPWTDARVRVVAAERAPSVREARRALDVAASGRVFGQRAPVGNPTVGVMVLPGFPDFGAWTTAVSLGLPIDVGGLRTSYAREAERGVEAARARLDDTTVRAVARARAAWVELAAARALVDIQRARAATAEEAVRRTRARVDAGAGTAVDLALAEREQAQAIADLARAEARAEGAVSGFREALDLDADAAVEVGPLERPTPVAADAIAAQAAAAPRRRDDVRAYERDAARFEAQVERYASASIAPLVVGLEGQQVAVGPQDLDVSLGASLRWELPLVQRAQGDRAMAQAEATAARGAGSALARQVSREVSRAALTLARHLAELDALERTAVPSAERLVNASEAAFAAGSLDYFRVLTARRELLELRARALDALVAAWGARIEYERALGRE